MLGDVHVYVDHVDALKVQLEREPRPFPTLGLRRRGENKRGRERLMGGKWRILWWGGMNHIRGL
jgi:hypothetical protein